MQFRQQRYGTVFSMVALELDNGECPAEDYLKTLKQSDEKVHESMLARIEYRSDNLIMHSKPLSRPLQGNRYKGLFRLIVKGERLLYCFLPNRLIVLLNGYDKNDNEKSAWEKARRYKGDIERQLEGGGLDL